jgi:ribosomal-protein-alanine N-acetyltransferase
VNELRQTGGGWVPEPEWLPMSEVDVPAVADIESRVQAFPWTPGHFLDSLKANYRCTVCRVGNETVGFAIVMQALDEAHLLNIAIDRSRQRLGYGSRLLRYAMSQARESGAATMLLEVRPSNAQAVELYRHFGFVQIGVRKGYYPSHSGREDAWVFVRSLDPLEGVAA